MRRRSSRSSIIATALLLRATAAVADENQVRTPFALEFCAGAEYDSNVAVLELDTSTGAGDVAATVDFHAGFDKRRPKGWSFDVAYDFTQSLYQQLGAYDLRVHRGSVGGGYDFGAVEAGLSYQYASATLASGENLTLSQITPSLGSLLGERLYLRLAWDRIDKRYVLNPGRNATTDAPSLDAYVFVDGVKSHVDFGYQRVTENAADDAFDYEGDKLKAQLTQRFVWWSRGVTLKTGLRYESRRYRAPPPPVFPPLTPPTPRREDQRYRFDLELEAIVSRHLFLRARYEYAHNLSTEPSVNFNENVASIGLGARL